LQTRSTSFGIALNLRWELDVWGRIRAGHSAAIADLEAASADAQGARLSIIAQTVKLWLAVVEGRRQVELADATRANSAASLARIEDRYARGSGSSLDVRLARSDLASTRANLERRRQQLDRTTRQLEILIGAYPDGSVGEGRELPAPPASVPAGLPAELVSRRPDLAASERRLAAAGARIDEARRALYPRISLTASGGTSSEELGDLVDGDFGVWSLAANLTQPIFQGGRIAAGIDLAKSRQREALHAYIDTALHAFAEVETALAADGHLALRETALAEATEQATAARELAQSRYERGIGDVIAVLESQRRAFLAESEWIAAQRERLDNRIDLYLALGGDYALWNSIANAQPTAR
jgi:NodT family efflux transporter outer membrane factor (OMF) lipoprotein